MILCLETSTTVCSAALCDRDGILAVRESSEDKSHAARLTLYIDELLSRAGIKAASLEAVAVSKGPGSYTGLRIGVSTAKGIAYAASIPMIGIETTLSMFHGINDEMKKNYSLDSTSLFAPMLDARRMEVYYSVYDNNGSKVKKISSEVINENSFMEVPGNIKILIFGDGAAKCTTVLTRPNILFASEFRISAAYMHIPAFQALDNNLFEDIAYFEPFYLKDFITSRPRKNILDS